MFTGIIETTGLVKEISADRNNLSFSIESELSAELKVDQSLAHNGVCLTVEAIDGNTYRVTAIHETLQKTNLGELKPGSVVNLERSLQFGGRIDGHIVQGHVDVKGKVESLSDEGGSLRISISHPAAGGYLTVEKGSVCVNGVSLTVVNSRAGGFEIAVIPYTLGHTNLGNLKEGDSVNIEFDVLGKYAANYMSLYADMVKQS
ncbi:MAG: riboflavin synthase [Bacteroidetes bacterium]|nr:riboflavin synthase [Bacteroidota bacterium]